MKTYSTPSGVARLDGHITYHNEKLCSSRQPPKARLDVDVPIYKVHLGHLHRLVFPAAHLSSAPRLTNCPLTANIVTRALGLKAVHVRLVRPSPHDSRHHPAIHDDRHPRPGISDFLRSDSQSPRPFAISVPRPRPPRFPSSSIIPARLDGSVRSRFLSSGRTRPSLTTRACVYNCATRS